MSFSSAQEKNNN